MKNQKLENVYDISIFEIFNLTEGSLSPVACINCGENFCTRADVCKTKTMWLSVDNLLNNYFKSVSVQDLLDGNVDIIEAVYSPNLDASISSNLTSLPNTYHYFS